MKYYYNGKLVRTSKEHHYTHAVIDVTTGKLIGCRSNEDAAKSVITSEIHRKEQDKENSRACIIAIKAGKRMYRYKDGRRSGYIQVDKEDTVEKCEKWVANLDKQIEYINQNWKVVELEER